MSSIRDTLLAAGPQLTTRYTLAELSPARIGEGAGLDERAFTETFDSVLDYINGLQQRFMDGLRDRIFKLTLDAPPGLLRVKLASEAYLSGCLEQRALRSWLIEARAQPLVAAGLRKQNQVYWLIVGSELATKGWPHPQAAGRLYLAMINEASVVEHRAGQVVTSVREALWDFLERGGPRT
ncbi:MAG TPA: hypothetical protein VGE57_02850 [Solimonas sp.]